MGRQQCRRVCAGLEATGLCSQPLSVWLHAQGHRVSLLLGPPSRTTLAPRREESGTFVRRRKGLGREGHRRHLRKALYMPALGALKHNPPLRAFAQRLAANGKPKMAIVCALMRKLIHIASGVLKHQQPFNPSLA